MRLRTICFLVGLSLALSAGVGFSARVAHADDDGPRAKTRPIKDAVAKLTERELALIKSKIKNWDDLDPARRQRLAHGMLRMRGMTDTERNRLRDHLKRKGKSRSHAGAALMNRGLATAVRKELGKDFERRLRQQDISEHAFEQAVAMRFWSKLAERNSETGDPVKPGALPADFPPRWRAHYQDGYARWLSAKSGKPRSNQARRLHHKLALARGEQLRSRLGTLNLRGEAYIAAVAAAVRKQWPEPFAELVKDPDALVRSAGRVELKRGIQRLVRRTSRLEKEESVLLVTLLSRLAHHHRPKTVVTGAAEPDDLIKTVLLREFKLTPEVVAQLPAADQPEARAKFLASHLGRFAHGLRGDKRRSAGAGTAKFERPKGLSDADWKIWTAAVSDIRRRKDFRALPELFKSKPEGMSDEGHALMKKAFRSRMGNRAGRGPRGRDGSRRDGGKRGPKSAGGEREQSDGK